MDIVFATATVVVAHPQSGTGVGIDHGSHWPADDPIVKAYPTFFTADARHGLSSSRPLGEDGYPLVTARSRVTAAPTETTTAAPGEKRARK